MDMQTALNIAGAIAGFLIIWVLTGLKDTMKHLQAVDAMHAASHGALLDKVHAIETLVVGEYPKRTEVEKDLAAIFKVCQRIEDKLDRKVDK